MQINHTIQICNKNNKVKGSLTVDIEFIQEYIPMYVEAAKLTLGIAVVGIIISVVVGLICANIQYYKVPVLKRIVSIYIELSRNTPLIVQLFLLYFGLPKAGIVLDSLTCAIVGLGFLGGSYMAESFRSGLESVRVRVKHRSYTATDYEKYHNSAGNVSVGTRNLREHYFPY